MIRRHTARGSVYGGPADATHHDGKDFYVVRDQGWHRWDGTRWMWQCRTDDGANLLRKPLPLEVAG